MAYQKGFIVNYKQRLSLSLLAMFGLDAHTHHTTHHHFISELKFHFLLF